MKIMDILKFLIFVIVLYSVNTEEANKNETKNSLEDNSNPETLTEDYFQDDNDENITYIRTRREPPSHHYHHSPPPPVIKQLIKTVPLRLKRLPTKQLIRVRRPRPSYKHKPRYGPPPSAVLNFKSQPHLPSHSTHYTPQNDLISSYDALPQYHETQEDPFDHLSHISESSSSHHSPYISEYSNSYHGPHISEYSSSHHGSQGSESISSHHGPHISEYSSSHHGPHLSELSSSDPGSHISESISSHYGDHISDFSNSHHEPQSIKSSHFGHNSISSVSYGPPPVQSYGAPPAHSYGAPPAPSYGAPPAPSYGAPPAPSYGAPSQPVNSYGAPVSSYSAPPATSYGVPSSGAIYGASGQPSNSYGAPPQTQVKSFAEPPASISVSYGSPPSSQPVQSYSPPSTSYGAPASPPATSYGRPKTLQQSITQSISSYIPPQQPSGPSGPYDSSSFHNLKGSFNTPIPVYTTRKGNFAEPQSSQESEYSDFIPSQNHEFELDESDNSGDLYETSISSYDVPINFESTKSSSRKKLQRNPNNNFDPSYLETEIFETTRSKVKKNKSTPPILPNTYDQEEFSTFVNRKQPFGTQQQNRDKNEKEFSVFYDESLGIQNINNKRKLRQKQNQQINSFSLIESDIPSEEFLDEIISPTLLTTTTSTTKRPRYRKKRPKTSSTQHILDTDDLRDAFGSGSKIHSTIVKLDSPPIFNTNHKSNRSPISRSTNNIGPIKNFVLTSSMNTVKNQNNNRTQYGTFDNNKYYNHNLNNINLNNNTKNNNNDIFSIQKSQSHSFYAGTVSPDLMTKFASKRNYDTAVTTSNNNDSINILTSGFYVSDIKDNDDNVDDENYNEFNGKYDNDYDNRAKIMNHKNSNEENVWDGITLPKNHKFTSRDVSF